MRLSRIFAGGAVVGTVVSVVATLALIVPANAATAIEYAALGDSYSSGVGTGSYYSNSGDCDRGPESYAVLWKAAHNVSAFDFAACLGASTTDVINGQLAGLSPATNVVTITIGGNDAGFTAVMGACVVSGDSGCRTVVNNAENYVRTTLPGLLDKTYAAIRAHAPNAAVYVLGYPRFYLVPGSCVLGLDNTKRDYVNGGVDVLDTAIATETGKQGRFRFVDVRGAFAAHEICSSGTSWLHSMDWTDIDESYHPTANGYQLGYLPALTTVTG
jgi:lysophospholipase L1-like esterase